LGFSQTKAGGLKAWRGKGGGYLKLRHGFWLVEVNVREGKQNRISRSSVLYGVGGIRITRTWPHFFTVRTATAWLQPQFGKEHPS
jgi:hypothetical protein